MPLETSPAESIARVLEASIRSDLRTFHDWFFLWLLISTGAVFLGVFLEGFELAEGKIESRLLRIDFSTGMLVRNRLFSELLSWVKRLVRIGWVVVLVGVVGEGVFEGLVSTSDEMTEQLDNALLSSTQREASAASARALEAESANKTLQQQLKTEADDAREKEAELTGENLRLRAIIQPRQLIPKQRADIEWALHPLVRSIQYENSVQLSSRLSFCSWVAAP